MTRYFDSIGPAGVQMMRQTAALQINVERGEDPTSRWRLLNALSPVIVALFANSRDYARRSTEWTSYRAQLWRTLDRSRTGIIYDESRPAERYLEFALNAIAMRGGNGSPHRRFRELMQDSSVVREDWLFHLSTLFPEVRPKEFFELRSADTIEPQVLAAPVVLVTGLIYDKESARRAAQLLGVPSEDLLERAARLGLADTEIRSTAAQVVGHALDGAQRLGSGYIAPAHIAVAEQYFARALSAADI
jgi:glutamate--cysteine ligase